MISPKIEAFRQLEGLPSPPGQILMVLEAIGRNSALDYNIVQMIQYDPGIALRVLKAANTPLYGFPARIASLQQAAGLLGPGAIRNIVMTTPVLERFQNNGAADLVIDFSRLWQHSTVTGALAGCLGNHVEGMETDVCFTAGLIHAAGKIALAVYHPRTLAKMIQQAARKKVPLTQVEQETLGYSHADVAAEMTRAWGFPQSLVHALGCCFPTPRQVPGDRLAGVIGLARFLADQWGFGDGMEAAPPDSAEGFFPLLNITGKDLEAWTPELREYASHAASEQEG
ncbi:MAG: HDOD domain-containing protein [Nitrospinaceae bacterium]